MKKIICVIMLFVLISFSTLCAEEQPYARNDIDQRLVLEVEDAVTENGYEDLGDVEEFMATKEVEGSVIAIQINYLEIRKEDGSSVDLYVDDETLVYVNDEKKAVPDIQKGDVIFAYYIEENGVFNCDWLEITR